MNNISKNEFILNRIITNTAGNEEVSLFTYI